MPVDDVATWSATQTITYTADGKGCETQVTFDEDGDGDVDSSAVYEMSFTLRLPDWIEEEVPDPSRLYPDLEGRMGLAIRLARRNVLEGSGGPFGAAVFEISTGRLISPGVNLVIPASCSVAHAEIVAIILAQQRLGSHFLGGASGPRYELVSSTEPCAMCLGALPWSGVSRLVCGARDEDARSIGFDEGVKPRRWRQHLAARGIEVVRDVLRREAAAALRLYAEGGGIIYNGCS